MLPCPRLRRAWSDFLQPWNGSRKGTLRVSSLFSLLLGDLRFSLSSSTLKMETEVPAETSVYVKQHTDTHQNCLSYSTPTQTELAVIQHTDTHQNCLSYSTPTHTRTVCHTAHRHTPELYTKYTQLAQSFFVFTYQIVSL